MVFDQLSEVFVASGVNKVNDNTFTAFYHGYNLRGKIVAPTVPVVDFIFYASIYPEAMEDFQDFAPYFSGKFGGNIPLQMDSNAVRVMLELRNMEIEQVKEILGEVTKFMMAEGLGAINIPPELPEPPKEEPVKAQPKKETPKLQQPQQPAQPKPAPKPPVIEDTTPFEEHAVLEKLTQIFIMGLNECSNNMFTTVFHGYNVQGKMLSPTRERVSFTFYGNPTENIAEAYNEFVNTMKSKYDSFSIRAVGGSLEVTFDFEGISADDCKKMLGEVSGFMIGNSIAAINLPSTVPVGTPYVPPEKPALPGQTARLSQTGQLSRATMPTPTSNLGGSSRLGSTGGLQYQSQPQGDSDQNNNFVDSFLKKFGKKP